MKGAETTGIARNPNILIVTPSFPPVSYGHDPRLAALAHELVSRGYSVDAVAIGNRFGNSFSANVEPGVSSFCVNVPMIEEVILGNFPLKPAYFTTALMVSLLRSVTRKPMLVIAHSNPIEIFYAGFLVSRFLGVKLVCDVTDRQYVQEGIEELLGPQSLPRRIGYSLLRSLASVFYRKVDMNVTNNPVYETYLQEVDHVDRERIETIQGMVDTAKFKPMSKSRTVEVRTRLELPQDRIVLVFVGNLDYYLEISHFFKVIKAISEIDTGLTPLLVVAGSGGNLDTLRKRANSLCPGDVVFLGQVAHESVAELVGCSDFGVFALEGKTASKFAQPTKVFEYFGCGKPVLAMMNEGHFYSFLKEFNLGLVTPLGDYRTMAASFVRLVRNRVLIEEMSRNARRVSEQFDVKLAASRIASRVLKVSD